MNNAEDKIQPILDRLDRLYHDLPLEYAGYALTAIHDIEAILYAAEHHSDKGYSIGTEEKYLEFVKKRNESK